MTIRFLMHSVFGIGGGVLTVVRNLAADLAARHDVEVVSVTRSREDPVHPMPENVRVRWLVDTGPLATDPDVHVPSDLIPQDEPHYRFYNRATDRALREFFDSIDEGAVIGMQPGVNLAVARLADPSVVRIGQMHRPFEKRRKELNAAMVRDLPRLDAFLTLTEADARLYRRRLDESLRIETIPNATPAYTGQPSTLDHKVAVAAGHLRANKGFDRLVATWAIVAQEHPDWELRIYGSGPQEQSLRARIADRGLDGKVRLMGYSTRLREEMAQASLFVMSSRKEAYGMVVVEAMSCGLPVVSFDKASGPASIIEHGVDGFLVPAGDLEALATRISGLIARGPEGRRPFAEAALRKAATLTQPAISARWEALVEDLQRKKRQH